VRAPLCGHLPGLVRESPPGVVVPRTGESPLCVVVLRDCKTLGNREATGRARAAESIIRPASRAAGVVENC